MGRHRDFWRLTRGRSRHATKSLGLDLTPDRSARLLEAYLTLTAFPDVKPGLEALKRRGLRLAILSNGAPKMLQAAVRGAGIVDLLDGILSVEEVKIFKPSPRLYHLASDHFRLRPTGDGIRVLQRVGRGRRGVGRARDVLDPAPHHRAAGGARLHRGPHRAHHHRSSRAPGRVRRSASHVTRGKARRDPGDGQGGSPGNWPTARSSWTSAFTIT